jgi:hypothetical protein
MPIGWLPDEGYDRPPGTAPRPPGPDPRPPDPPEDDRWDRWREAYPVIWEIWRTSGDERVCPICGPLAGLEYQVGEGPLPPLHGNCRCVRVTSRVEWRLR